MNHKEGQSVGQKTNSLIVFDELLITYASHTLQFYEVFFGGGGGNRILRFEKVLFDIN